MKRFVAILVFSCLLLSNTELHQLLKVPDLVEHYVEHRSQNAHLSFTEFLALHYGNTSQHAQDDSHQEKLPFKSDDCSLSSLHATHPEMPFRLQYHVMPELPLGIILSERGEDARVIDDIWQPPRRA